MNETEKTLFGKTDAETDGRTDAGTVGKTDAGETPAVEKTVETGENRPAEAADGAYFIPELSALKLETPALSAGELRRLYLRACALAGAAPAEGGTAEAGAAAADENGAGAAGEKTGNPAAGSDSGKAGSDSVKADSDSVKTDSDSGKTDSDSEKAAPEGRRPLRLGPKKRRTLRRVLSAAAALAVLLTGYTLVRSRLSAAHGGALYSTEYAADVPESAADGTADGSTAAAAEDRALEQKKTAENGAQTEENTAVAGMGLANPFVPVENAQALAAGLGLTLDAPAGAENTAYSLMDGTMGQVSFELGGAAYTLRAQLLPAGMDALTQAGIYETLTPLDPLAADADAGTPELTLYESESGVRIAVWSAGAYTCTLTADGADAEAFAAAAKASAAITAGRG